MFSVITKATLCGTMAPFKSSFENVISAAPIPPSSLCLFCTICRPRCSDACFLLFALFSNRLPEVSRMRYGCFIIYGFDYDDSNGDYKVVVILCVLGSGGSYETEEVKVFSLQTGSWRRIGDFCYGIPLDESGTFVNGFLHWATSAVHGLSYAWDIVSLDLATNIYGKVAQPNYGDGGFDSTLWILRGCVCVLCNFPEIRADIWVMKEYGKTEGL